MKLGALDDSYRMITDIIEDHLGKIEKKYVDPIIKTVDLLAKAKEEKRYVHITGAGRSKIAGEIFGELLKNLGINVSIIGETLSKPVREGDVVIAVSSSGWTNTTLFAVEQSIKLGAKVIGFTASKGSKLDRLSDITILIPGKPQAEDIPYIARQLMGRHKTPLTPMGTVSELSTILIGMGIVYAIHKSKQGIMKSFRESIKTILNEAEVNRKKILEQPKKVIEYLEILSKNVGNENRRFYITGAGICRKVADMVAMRYQHLAINVQPLSNWRFRSQGDVLITISGSGENPIILQYAEEAHRNDMLLVSLTANENSKLAKISDISLVFKDISIREDYIKLRIGEDSPIFMPIFEAISLLFLESTVAQVAEVHQISEEKMRSLHANVE
ncbi:MAG: SIS domain-containing protein [Candidatus Njordarchaeia archaeon]